MEGGGGTQTRGQKGDSNHAWGGLAFRQIKERHSFPDASPLNPGPQAELAMLPPVGDPRWLKAGRNQAHTLLPSPPGTGPTSHHPPPSTCGPATACFSPPQMVPLTFSLWPLCPCYFFYVESAFTPHGLSVKLHPCRAQFDTPVQKECFPFCLHISLCFSLTLPLFLSTHTHTPTFSLSLWNSKIFQIPKAEGCFQNLFGGKTRTEVTHNLDFPPLL